MSIRIKPAPAGKVRVQFILSEGSLAGPVSVVGSFNNWRPGAHRLQRRANGTRSVSVLVTPGEELHFRYLGADGDWFDDPDAELTDSGGVIRLPKAEKFTGTGVLPGTGIAALEHDAEMLLPARLAYAAAPALGVDGAGISYVDRGFRIPLGASDALSGMAERLQFTQGEGPCLTAAQLGQTDVAGTDELISRWPTYAQELFASTPYIAVATVPVPIAGGCLVLDLYASTEADLASLDPAAVAGVTAQIADSLGAVRRTKPSTNLDSEPAAVPGWLTGPSAQGRQRVWLAIGMLMSRLDVNSTDALALLRGHSYAAGSDVDDISAKLVDGSLDLDELT